MVQAILAAVYCVGLVVSIFFKGWLFPAAMCLYSIGIMVYVDETATLNGKPWILAALGLIALYMLVRMILGFSRPHHVA